MVEMGECLRYPKHAHKNVWGMREQCTYTLVRVLFIVETFQGGENLRLVWFCGATVADPRFVFAVCVVL